MIDIKLSLFTRWSWGLRGALARNTINFRMGRSPINLKTQNWWCHELKRNSYHWIYRNRTNGCITFKRLKEQKNCFDQYKITHLFVSSQKNHSKDYEKYGLPLLQVGESLLFKL